MEKAPEASVPYVPRGVTLLQSCGWLLRLSVTSTNGVQPEPCAVTLVPSGPPITPFTLGAVKASDPPAAGSAAAACAWPAPAARKRAARASTPRRPAIVYPRHRAGRLR